MKVVGRPVLLIHGIDDTSALFERMAEFLRSREWEVHTVDLNPNNGDAGLDQLAGQVADYVAANFADGQRIDLVGFSMGGLVARYYVQRMSGLDRVRRFISISSPHRGTWTAFGRWNAGARQMRPGSPFLTDLDRDSNVLERVGFTSIWTALDLMILPARSSVLGVGKSIRLNVAVHAWMVRDKRVMRTVAELLEEKLDVR